VNSKYALEQLPEIMGKLLTRSAEGKVEWREDHEPDLFEQADVVEAFCARLEKNSTVSIEVSTSEIAFVISNNEPPSRRLLEIKFDRVPPRYGFDSAREEGAYNVLIELHEIARRIALDLDAKVEGVKGYLDNLV